MYCSFTNSPRASGMCLVDWLLFFSFWKFHLINFCLLGIIFLLANTKQHSKKIFLQKLPTWFFFIYFQHHPTITVLFLCVYLCSFRMLSVALLSSRKTIYKPIIILRKEMSSLLLKKYLFYNRYERKIARDW